MRLILRQIPLLFLTAAATTTSASKTQEDVFSQRSVQDSPEKSNGPWVEQYRGMLDFWGSSTNNNNQRIQEENKSFLSSLIGSFLPSFEDDDVKSDDKNNNKNKGNFGPRPRPTARNKRRKFVGKTPLPLHKQRRRKQQQQQQQQQQPFFNRHVPEESRRHRQKQRPNNKRRQQQQQHFQDSRRSDQPNFGQDPFIQHRSSAEDFSNGFTSMMNVSTFEMPPAFQMDMHAKVESEIAAKFHEGDTMQDDVDDQEKHDEEFEYSQVDIDDDQAPDYNHGQPKHGESNDDASDVAGFCEAAAATVRENAVVPHWAEERMTRPELMDHLWLLVEFYGMPVTREGGRGPQSEWQMLVLLQAVCKFEVEGIGVPMIQPKEDYGDIGESKKTEGTTMYYGNFVEVTSEKSPTSKPNTLEEPEIITASPVDRQRGSQHSIQQQINSSKENQFVVSTGFTFASDEDKSVAKVPPIIQVEDDDTTKPPMRPGTVIDDISPFEEESRRPKRQHNLKNYFPQEDGQQRRRDETDNPDTYYPHRAKNKPYTRSRRPVPFPQAIKPQTDPHPPPSSQVRGGILGTPAPRLPKPINADTSSFAPPPSATTLHQLAKNVIDKNTHISTTILPDFSQHRRSSAPPLPLDTVDLESSSFKPRNITLDDVHYVYNLTFDDKKPYSAKHHEDEYYEIQPEITTTGVASDDYYLNFYYDDNIDNDDNGKTALPPLPGFQFTTDNIQPRSKPRKPAHTTPIPYYPQDDKSVRGMLPPPRKKQVKLGHELTPFHAPPDTHMTYGTRTPMTNHEYPEIEDLTASAYDDNAARPRHPNKPRVKSDHLTLLGSSGQGARRRNRNQQHRKPIRTMQRVPFRKTNSRPPLTASFDHPEPMTTTAPTTSTSTTTTTTTTTTRTTVTTITTTPTATTTTSPANDDEYEYYYVYSDEEDLEGNLEEAYNGIDESNEIVNEKAPRFDDEEQIDDQDRDFFPAGPKLSHEELIISTQDPYREDYSTDDFGTDSRLAHQDRDRKTSYFGDGESSELNEALPSRGGLRNDRFAEDGLRAPLLPITSNGELEQRSEDGEDGSSSVDPEKLAYILIGVCCGLSVLCLVVVAVSIGYRSETHYRLDDGSGRSRRIRLLRASSSSSSGREDEDDSSGNSHNNSHLGTMEAGQLNSNNNESGMKLGTWFNGRSRASMDRSDNRPGLIFPTPVFLSNLSGEEKIAAASANIGNNNGNSSNEDNNSLSSLEDADHVLNEDSEGDGAQNSNSRVQVLPTEAAATTVAAATTTRAAVPGRKLSAKMKMRAKGTPLTSRREKRMRNMTISENGNNNNMNKSRVDDDASSVNSSNLSSVQAGKDRSVSQVLMVQEDGLDEQQSSEIRWSDNQDRLI